MQTKNLTTRDWYYLHAPQDRNALANSIGISEVHLRKVMTKEKRAGRYLALRLEQATPYDRHDFRPDIFGSADQQEEAAA